MAVHDSTEALGAELEAPSVLSFDDYREASRRFRPQVHAVSAQASKVQQLLVDVEEDEENEEVRGKLESLRQTQAALQMQHDKVERHLATISLSMRRFWKVEVPDVLATIERNR